MKFEFDPDKDQKNLFKHGISLDRAEYILTDEGRVTLPSFRDIDGEPRFKLIGMMNARLYTLIFVWRNSVCYCISLRRSNSHE
jgi:uncharacterized protein